MFTKNWYKAISQVMGTSLAPTTYVNADGGSFQVSNSISSGVIQLNGATSSVYAPSMNIVRKGIDNGVIFGSGRTPPTVDDYKLSGSIITTISATPSYEREVVDDGVIFTGVYTLTNTGAEDITIGEVGLLASASDYSSQTFLVERTILDEPLTIPAGGIGKVTYEIKLVYPTD